MFQPADEARPRAELEALQSERLTALVTRVAEAVPLYRDKFAGAGLDPAGVRGLEDLTRIPFTVKDDLRSAYPYGMFAVPRRDIVRVHASSGTTGQVTVVGYTRDDISMWSDMMARTLAGAGAGADDVVQVTYGYGLFTGGLGAHYGSERLGSLTIPLSGGNTARQVTVMKDFGTTILACTPSYAFHIAEAAAEMRRGRPRAPAARRRLRRRAVERRDAACSWRPRSARRRTTSTAFPRCSARASRSSASTRTACT